MFNVSVNKSQLQCAIIKYYNAKKFKNNNYLAISIFKLLLFMIIIDI